ncbi:hypothetical protein [Bacillus thuringiensis]|uniref:hypothetical protein n=1 Tax=Bacillus thuringiensis TaxID=1428 RepID=UPI000BF89DAB|nr:hypothetical protein [Bacillus thuringiensis]PES54375.1 hypothetical protein CN506_20075 [Bacillus thuringiensis]
MQNNKEFTKFELTAEAGTQSYKGILKFQDLKSAMEYAYNRAWNLYGEAASNGQFPTIFDYYEKGMTYEEAIDTFTKSMRENVKYTAVPCE